MKTRVADWFYEFWYKNHTHLWQMHDTLMIWEKCRRCGDMRNTRTRTPKQFFKDEKPKL